MVGVGVFVGIGVGVGVINAVPLLIITSSRNPAYWFAEYPPILMTAVLSVKDDADV
jgi:hypothetical protein